MTRSPGQVRRSIQLSAKPSGNIAKYGHSAWNRLRTLHEPFEHVFRELATLGNQRRVCLPAVKSYSTSVEQHSCGVDGRLPLAFLHTHGTKEESQRLMA